MSAKRESGGRPERTRRCIGIVRPTLVPCKSHWVIFPGRRGWVPCPESEDLPYVNKYMSAWIRTLFHHAKIQSII